MYTETCLPVTALAEPVPNLFYRQQGETRVLSVLLPGYHYSSDEPLLAYPRRLLLDETCADVLQVDYAYHAIPGFINRPESERYARLDADVSAALAAALEQRSYQRLVVIGKSLGTAAMGLLLSRADSLPAAKWVWLTPLLTDPRLTGIIRTRRPESLFAIGTADRFYNADVLEDLRAATGGQALVIPDANHGLEIPGSVERSLDALKQVVLAIKAFAS